MITFYIIYIYKWSEKTQRTLNRIKYIKCWTKCKKKSKIYNISSIVADNKDKLKYKSKINYWNQQDKHVINYNKK